MMIYIIYQIYSFGNGNYDNVACVVCDGLNKYKVSPCKHLQFVVIETESPEDWRVGTVLEVYRSTKVHRLISSRWMDRIFIWSWNCAKHIHYSCDKQ